MPQNTMNRTFLVATVIAASASLNLGAATAINGSGATFPAPLYLRWASDFKKSNPDITINYQGIGSGAGVTQFIQGITDFGASDVAMKDDELLAAKATAGGRPIMIPSTAGSIVLAYNVPGVQTGLKLTRAAYIGILCGNIKTWSAPEIAKANPEVNLPSLPITVVTRSDASGTTAVFTGHCAEVSAEFTSVIGSGKSVTWPVGVAGKGNDGVTALIKQTRGAIGYVEYGFAANNKLAMAALQNKAGNFITPSVESSSTTLASIKLPANLRFFILDPQGANDYPIVTFTWLLLKATYADAAKGAAVKAFVTYALTKGQATAPQLGYVTLPAEVVTKAQAALETVK
jgi:phosphate transport system substrate-binding protein